MLNNIIGRRPLILEAQDQAVLEFAITILHPARNDGDEWSCEVSSDDVLFNGWKKIYGVDAIDAINNAIRFLDDFAFITQRGRVLWPDRSPYASNPRGGGLP